MSSRRLLALLCASTFDALDGPGTGAVLSGGVDSSTVVCLAHMVMPDMPTYTGYYDEPGYSELEYAALVGGPNWNPVLITAQDFIENFDAMVPWLEEPYQGMGTFGQYMVGKRLARDGIRVALSGEGSDELFGGYPRLHIVAGEKPPVNYEGYRPPADYPATVEEALQYDLDRLPDLLAVDDQCMRAHGVEARAPFTDKRVVDFALALPVHERIKKRYLKATVSGIVPDAILDRRDNMGFPIPLVQWANGPLRDWVGDRLGYTPDPEKPWDRGWWHELIRLAKAQRAVVAA